MSARTVAVIQARMGSTRLPGKVLERIGDRSLLAWTVDGRAGHPGRGHGRGRDDDRARVTTGVAEAAAALGVEVHRGPVRDVLTRCYEAVAPHEPELVLRQTADNPFPDPSVAAAQVEALVAGELDYVGIAGWPIGIAAEVCRMEALSAAMHEATAAPDREHVTPFLYSHPERFRLGTVPRTPPVPAGGERWRYTVDTPADLELARALADRLGHGPPVRLGELETIMAAEPALARLNAAVVQKPWQVAQATEGR